VDDKITESDWALLSQMRQGYLGERAQTLWTTSRSLEVYDKFFGRRIADKWFSALNVFAERGDAQDFLDWRTQLGAPLQIWDWGCGTGRASRSFCQALAIDDPVEAVFTDRGEFIEAWAHHQLVSERGERSITKIPSSKLQLSNTVLLISHVLNELEHAKAGSLSDVAARAEWIFWVENGSRSTSRALAGVRNKIRHTHDILAPCLGQTGCQAIEGKDHSHWCHFFAERTAEYFLDPEWSEFSKRLGVDLRSIPYSFFIARRKREGSPAPTLSVPLPSTHGVHIGRARVYKGYADALVCENNTRLEDWRYPKRSYGEIYRELKKDQASFVLERPESK
jgi:hypothetical protein